MNRWWPGAAGALAVVAMPALAMACPDAGTLSHMQMLRNRINTTTNRALQQGMINDYNNMVNQVNAECRRRAQQEAWQRQQEQQRRQQEQIRQWNERTNQMLRESNHARANAALQRGNQELAAGDYQAAIAAYDTAIEHLAQNADNENIAVVRTRRLEAERRYQAERARRQEAEERAAAAAKPSDVKNRAESVASGGPPDSLGDTRRVPSTRPTYATGGRIDPATPAAETDKEIAAKCADAPNPRACEAAEREYRERFGRRPPAQTQQADPSTRTPGATMGREPRGESTATKGGVAALLGDNPWRRPPSGTDSTCPSGENCSDRSAGQKHHAYSATMPERPSGRHPAADKTRDVLRRLVAVTTPRELDALVTSLAEAAKEMPQGAERERLEKLAREIRAQLSFPNQPARAKRSAGGAVDNPTAERANSGDRSSTESGTPLPPAALSGGAEEALTRPAPGDYKDLSEAECRKWRGLWSEAAWGTNCTIREENVFARGAGRAGDHLLIVDEPRSVTDESSLRTVRELVQRAQKELYATSEDPDGQWMGRPVPPAGSTSR